MEGQELAFDVLDILEEDRCDERFELFWQLTKKIAENLDVDEAELSRSR